MDIWVNEHNIMDALLKEDIECWAEIDEEGFDLHVDCKDYEKAVKVLKKLGINPEDLVDNGEI